MKTEYGKLLRCQFNENLKMRRGNHAVIELAEGAETELHGGNCVCVTAAFL
jgi:hypothetical protein